MNISQSLTGDGGAVKPLPTTLHFSMTLFRANLRNIKALAVTLGLPLFMLFTIWVPALAGDGESQELMQLLFPAISFSLPLCR